jgi:hypothetical protein
MSGIRGWSRWVVEAGERTAGLEGVGDSEHSTKQAAQRWTVNWEEPSLEALRFLIRREPREAIFAALVCSVLGCIGVPTIAPLPNAKPMKSLRGQPSVAGIS